MDRWFRRAEITLLVMLGFVYLAAKIHFFTRYQDDSSRYVAEHWPFWAAMAVIAGAAAILEGVRQFISSKTKSEDGG